MNKYLKAVKEKGGLFTRRVLDKRRREESLQERIKELEDQIANLTYYIVEETINKADIVVFDNRKHYFRIDGNHNGWVVVSLNDEDLLTYGRDIKSKAKKVFEKRVGADINMNATEVTEATMFEIYKSVLFHSEGKGESEALGMFFASNNEVLLVEAKVLGRTFPALIR